MFLYMYIFILIGLNCLDFYMREDWSAVKEPSGRWALR